MVTAVTKRRRADSPPAELKHDEPPASVMTPEQPLQPTEGFDGGVAEHETEVQGVPDTPSSAKGGYKKRPTPRKASAASQKKNGAVMKGVSAPERAKVFAFNVSKELPKAVRDSVPIIPPEPPDSETYVVHHTDTTPMQEQLPEQAVLENDVGVRRNGLVTMGGILRDAKGFWKLGYFQALPHRLVNVY